MTSSLCERDHAALDKRPERERLAEPEKAALIAARWAEVQCLTARLAALETTAPEPRTEAHHSSVPPSHTPTANRPPGPRAGTRREASGGRAGGGRPRHPEPDQVIMAQAQACPPGGGTVQAHEPPPHAVDDTIEWPPVKPIVSRVEPYAGPCPPGGPSAVAPVPVGLEPGTPCGASIQSLATDRRSPHAIRDVRLSALFIQVYGVSIRAGALAHLCQRVNTRLDDRVTEMLTPLRSSRLICREETSARVHGRTPWEWVFQHAAVGVPVMRPRRGHGVIPEVLGDHRPTGWVADLDRAHTPHPAEAWHVCWAHQLRDCPLALEAGDPVCAPRMKAVWRRALALHKRRDPSVASTLYPYRCALQRRVHRGLALQPAHPHGRRLQTRDAQIQDPLCWCLDDAARPPTNHSSEQAIRLSTVLRKVTHGLRSEGGRDLLAAVRSVVNTGTRHGLSAYQAIQTALAPIGS